MSAVQEAAEDRAERLASAPPAVVVDGVTKTFRLPRHQFSTLKERVLHVGRANPYDDFHALRDVSVEIKRGEFFGIVGRNGSGKSTLLKCLAGIYRPNGGSVDVRGRLSPFIELGVGFNPDLAALDNVLINSVMMGMSRKEARKRFDDVIAFAELEEFVDLKLKNYSSGMSVRLGFATAIQAHADVLLVDEVLAVGDAAFQQKCFEEFQRLKDEGRTIVFVTHDMGAVERFCDRAMLIERGDVMTIGKPREIARAYNELNFGRLVHEASDEDRYGDQSECEITDAWIEHDGEPASDIAQGDHLTIAVAATFHRRVEHPIFGLSLRNDVGHTVFTTTTEWQHVETPVYEAGDRVVVRVGVDAYFGAGLYKLTPSVALSGLGANALDLREDLVSFYVHATRTSGGLVDLPHDFRIERA
jgi:ABC-type polysaccharide/polyol phosphate transport system ATPase subunit